MKKFIQKKTKEVYSNLPYFSVVEDEVVNSKGVSGRYARLVETDFVIAIPVFEDGKTCLVTQYRYPVDLISAEFPMGALDEGEGVLEGLKREFKEETNLEFEHATEIGYAYVSNSRTNQKGYVFIVEGISGKMKGQSSDFEDISVEKVGFKEIDHMIQSGIIHDGPTISALYFYRLYQNS